LLVPDPAAIAAFVIFYAILDRELELEHRRAHRASVFLTRLICLICRRPRSVAIPRRLEEERLLIYPHAL
jgi:hypothetical protein